MSLCIAAAGKVTVLAVSAFTLSWTHSVEKTRWEEDWRVTPAGLTVAEARIEGSGAGMEPPADARFDGRFWHYRPKLPPQPALVLGRSGATGGGWRLCTATGCLEPGGPEMPGAGPVTLSPC